jgi:hypothetical protein
MKKDLEAAFARPHSETDVFIHHAQNGMTLRDYFAAKALQGIMASGIYPTGIMFDTAKEAYEMADAMLEARKA